MKAEVVFASLYIGYMLNIFAKRCVTFALPDIIKSEGFSKDDLGMILSGQMLAYAIGKFVAGLLIDSVSPALVLSLGYICSGVTVLLFASVPKSMWLYALLWILNGFATSPAWPSSAVIMKKWFSPEQFGTAWSLLSTSINMAGTLGPLLTAFLATYSGWRSSLLLPGSLLLGFGFLTLIFMKNAPEGSSHEHLDKGKPKASDTMSKRDLFWLPGYRGICFTYLIISTVQFGTMQWGPVYLVQDLGHSIIVGNSFISSLEIGGICGSVIAGYSSDHFLTKWKSRKLASRFSRQYVIGLFALGLAIFLNLLKTCVTSSSSMIWINIIGFGIGMTLYGPISVLGLAAMECAPEKMAGTAHAVVCLFSNFGQTISGYPLSLLLTWISWQSACMIQMIFVIQVAVYLLVNTTYSFKQASSSPKSD
ncbi:glucose-6-phosphate exchanger SLC37A4-like isoform X2 [Dreissena polymorpha]|uniref:glucose-6-phosphate exchanger SLC37A4-like isoform X2 n=1 Tax=Dreissena polymorpha TaxID=45954 RepID=UPI00226552ED|nr:glucose-6-phosphate exchanger SLC37A4-like isoform X2 [Dreissena polymorpha]